MLRYAYPLMVTVTGGRFLPWPSASTTSGGTANPVAVRPSSRIVVVNRMSGSVPPRPVDRPDSNMDLTIWKADIRKEKDTFTHTTRNARAA